MLEACKRLLPGGEYDCMARDVEAVRRAVQARTAWRVEGTLREFPKFASVNMWFDYPIHRMDESGALRDIQPEAERPAWQKKQTGKAPEQDKRGKRLEKLRKAFEACDMEGKGEVNIAELVDYTGMTRNTVKNYIDEHPDYERGENGTVKLVSKQGVKVSKI